MNLEKAVRIMLLIILIFCSAYTDSINIGYIAKTTSNEVTGFQAIAQYISNKLSEITKTNVSNSIVVARSVKEMCEKIRLKKVDIYFDSPLPSLLVNNCGNSAAVLRQWKDGKSQYMSIIFVKKGNLMVLSDLYGKTIGFKDINSSSGYLLPRLEMQLKGFNFGKEGNIKKVFTYDNETTIVQVLRNKLDAGAMSLEDFEKYAGKDIGSFHILHVTEAIPRRFVNLRRDTSTVILVNILQEMDKDVVGKTVLKKFGNTKKFDEIPLEHITTLWKLLPALMELPDE